MGIINKIKAWLAYRNVRKETAGAAFTVQYAGVCSPVERTMEAAVDTIFANAPNGEQTEALRQTVLFLKNTPDAELVKLGADPAYLSMWKPFIVTEAERVLGVK